MRIGIVNDLPLAVQALRGALAQRPQHRVIWVAEHGAQALELCARETPDLVLMDLWMPQLDGVEATRRIMASTPCPVLIVTANVAAHAGHVFEAMGHGALDAIDTPPLERARSGGTAAFLTKLDSLELRLRELVLEEPARAAAATPAARAAQPELGLVAIGASAGGPAALAALLRGLPATFPAAVVVVQHVDEQFAAGMADWLDQSSALPVRLAEEGAPPLPGGVLLAGTNHHLVLDRALRLRYTPEPRELLYRPSIDVFFHSVQAHWRGSATGVLLTGMGQDGARGLKALHDSGHHTIAQDRGSSAVYGMPKAAAELGAAAQVVAVGEIAAVLQARFPGS